jgi:hypothetical protein
MTSGGSSRCGSDSTDCRRLGLFTFFWAAQTMLEMGKWGDMMESPLQFLLFALAFLAFLRPENPLLLVFLSVLQVAIAFIKLPWISNHMVVITVVNLTIVASLIHVAWTSRSEGKSPFPSADPMASKGDGPKIWADWLATFAPFLRAELLIVYSLASFHKLNTDFFNPEQSCAAILWHRMARITPWSGSLIPLGEFMPYVSLLIEILIPMLLARRRWKLAGVFLGLMFHTLLGAVGFFRFSSTFTALYCLFLPDWVVDSIHKELRFFKQRWLPSWRKSGWTQCFPWRRSLPILLMTATIGALFLVPTKDHRQLSILLREQTRDSGIKWSLLFQSTWLLGTVAVVAALCFIIWKYRAEKDLSKPAVKPGWLWVFPALTILNGAGPYLGLKTEASFSMFSNLRTGEYLPNHLVIRNTFALIPEGDDLVEIVATSDAELSRLRDRNYRIVWMELCSYIDAKIHDGKDFGLSIRRNGVLSEFASVQTARNAFEIENLIVRKLSWFRPVSMEPVCPCTH